MASEPPGASRALEGSWRVTVTPKGIDPFEALATYAAGGGYIFTDTFPNPVSPTPAHGAWEFVEPRVFRISFVKFNFNSKGQIEGSLNVRGTITLNDTGDEYTSQEQVEVRNPEGEVIFANTATTAATRMRVER